MRRSLLRVLGLLLVLLVVAAAAAVVWGYRTLRGSLAHLDGQVVVAGLSGPVEVLRDELGIPTIRGSSREDVARATGFVHAQERFFQMDLARRQAAGELAELVGAAALPLDRDMRRHRFRAVAREAVDLLEVPERALLEAYTAGVNAGLGALRAAPFEYLLLRQDPRPWTPDDSLLVVLAMFVTLQDTEGRFESTVGTLHDVLPPEMARFLAPPGTEWDAPLVGGALVLPEVPGPDVYDPRRRRQRSTAEPRRPASRTGESAGGSAASVALAAARGAAPRRSPDSPAEDWPDAPDHQAVLGSNNWAVAGRLAADGGALVANDMHLTVRVPNTWYRLVLEWPDPGIGSGTHRLMGVTLPGVPSLVAGSNAEIAWGFTNTYADWSDLVLLEVAPDDVSRYRTPEGLRPFDRHDEVIRVAGEADQVETVTWTVWGPVLGRDHHGRLRAYRWVAHDAERLASGLTPLERARSVDEAFDAANGVGAPGQNLLVADRAGRIGWTVYGSLPRRVGHDGRQPTSWSDGTRGWDGWLEPSAYPRLVDPAEGRLWTANARVVGGEMLERLGDGGYDVGARAFIIRDRLMQGAPFTPEDLFAIQLDTGADFLVRWHDLLLRTLTPEASAGTPQRARLRQVVQDDWTGHASPESAGYRLTRRFRDEVSDRVIAFVLAECDEADPAFDYRRIRNREGPIWAMVSERPLHLLDPQYGSWNDLLLDAADAVYAEAMSSGEGELADRTWAESNVTQYRHPLSAQLPLAGRWLDMPLIPLPGDVYTPRVQWRAQAASIRMVVSPGREEKGIMQMPTGQSGHPLSPFYANSHPAWVKGEPSPFLPGETRYRLVLVAGARTE